MGSTASFLSLKENSNQKNLITTTLILNRNNRPFRKECPNAIVCLKMLYTIRGLRKDVRGASLRVRVLSMNEVRTVKTKDGEAHRVVDAQVGDSTGQILLSVWDEKIEQIQEGDLIDITDGYVTRFKGRYRLNLGRYGGLERVDDDEFPTREDLLKGRRWNETSKASSEQP